VSSPASLDTPERSEKKGSAINLRPSLRRAMGDSFLLDSFDKATGAWVRRWSLVAVPPLRLGSATGEQAKRIQRNRDIFVLAMLVSSAASIILLRAVGNRGVLFVERALPAFALYRCMDLIITLVRTGVLLSFRGDVPLRDAPRWLVQRILLGVLLNYAEIILWFTVIYRQLSLTSPCQFAEPLTRISQAFNLSFSTMTTIGYGKYGPNGMVSNLLAFTQVTASLILLALVVSSVLALLTSLPEVSSAKAAPAGDKHGYLRPLILFVLCFAMFYWLFGVRLCSPWRAPTLLDYSTSIDRFAVDAHFWDQSTHGHASRPTSLVHGWPAGA
jgi:hypothetical protein